MLALLIYCYTNDIFSSRRIERATYRDVAMRYLTADTQPDHDTICAFRRNNLEAAARAFVDVLELPRELKLLQLGTISLDGTHINASASKDRNGSHVRARQLRAHLRRDVNALLQQAEHADQKDEDSQALPKEIARRGNNATAKAPNPGRRRPRPKPTNKSTSPIRTRASCARTGAKATPRATTARRWWTQA